MKKFRLALFTIVAVLVLSVTLVACQPEANELTIADVKVYLRGEAVDINPSFSVKAEAIEYQYDENGLEIIGGKVKGLKEGEYEVTAKANTCETTFKVSCVLPIKVDDLYAWVGYPASDISPVINVDGDVKVKYTTTSDIISIEGNNVTALKTGNAEVTAEIEGFTTTFNVTCSAVDRNDTNKFYYVFSDGSDWGWRGKAQSRRLEYNQKGTDGKTTVFIGDSFFDIDFFSAFNSFYPAKTYDALCHGIGGTTSNTWELMLDDYFDGIQPKNVVIQLGNNNYYNDKAPVTEVAEDLQRFLTYIHYKMPNTQLYYFAITPRVAIDPYTQEVKQINKLMEKFCAPKDWVVFLDTTDQMVVNWTTDGIHPMPAKYQIFVDALAEAGLKIEEK